MDSTGNGIFNIACIGEVMVELAIQNGNQAIIGTAGDTYNTAVYLKKLDHNAELKVDYITALGSDAFSDRILMELKTHNIGSEFITIRDGMMPGLYAISTDEKGERSFSYWRGQAAARTLISAPSNVTIENLSTFDIVYLSGISMAILPPDARKKIIERIKEFRNRGGKLAFDSNYRPRLWEDLETARNCMMDMWAITDIALPSIDDEMELFDDQSEKQVLDRLSNAGVGFGALKRGAMGPKTIGEDIGEIDFKPITKVVDTTAAGDSFNAGFLYTYATHNDMKQALIAGHELASKVVQSSGAIINL